MSSANIIFGVLISLIGIYAIAFNKYPGKQVSYESAKKKYDTVNERKLTVFDGGFCIAYGVAYIFLGIYILAILLIAYYPVRTMLLKHKYIWKPINLILAGIDIYVCPCVFLLIQVFKWVSLGMVLKVLGKNKAILMSGDDFND